MKEITFCDHQFMLHPSGLLFWPSQKMAIVADLHLEKASHFAGRGQFLPPHDSYETLKRLQQTLSAFDISQLILLGDSFHDPQGFQRLNDDAQELFESLIENYEVIWITGNHDGTFIPENTIAYDELEISGIWFRHEANAGAGDEISGHFHPKASLKLQGCKVTKPCFIEDGRKMILPAFGCFTGGLDVQDPVFDAIFCNDFVIHLLGRQKIYSTALTKM